MKDHKQEIFSDRVSAGSRTYFFDVKVTREGAKYLTISEVNSRGDHLQIMVFEDHILDFQAGLEGAVDFIIQK
jgi:hypothetical protein